VRNCPDGSVEAHVEGPANSVEDFKHDLATGPQWAVVTQLGELGPVDPYTVRDARFMIRAPGNTLAGPSTPVRLRVRPERGPALIVETSFLSPPGGGED